MLQFNMVTEYIPTPLFDTLEYLDEANATGLKASLPQAISTAQQDYGLTINFLQAYRGSAETFKSYRREIERLLQWSWFIHGKSLKDLRREDMEVFFRLLPSAG